MVIISLIDGKDIWANPMVGLILMSGMNFVSPRVMVKQY